MGTWVTVNADYVIGTMTVGSGGMLAAYETALVEWPQKVGRLSEITAGVVAEFREGLRNEGAEALDEDTSKLPIRCAGHAAVLARFHMAVEILHSIAGENVASEIRIELAGASDDSDERMELSMARQALQSLRDGKGPIGTPRYKSRANRSAEAAGVVGDR
jgi:hypothetical protein